MMMEIAYWLLLIFSMSLMMSQLLVAKKKTVHIVFAIFCGSLSMVALQELTHQSLGVYSYLIGIGTCATCNVFWLVSRALFREQNPIAARHILLAVIIALLIVAGQGINMVNAISPDMLNNTSPIKLSIVEIVGLLSSTILVLSFWEACRGFKAADRTQKLQRLLFMYAFGTGLFLCMIVADVLVPALYAEQLRPYFVAFSAIQILVVTQVIIIWQGKQVLQYQQEGNQIEPQLVNENHQVDQELMSNIRKLLVEDKLFLQTSLKMLDIAQHLQVPEYKVSKVVRYGFQANNFNQFINNLRLEHARSLLEEESAMHWSVLVIALESGFASIASFNRAFKAQFKCTPSEYRKQFCSERCTA